MSLKITDPNLTLLMDTYAQPLTYYAGRLCSCVASNGGRPKIGCGCDLGFYYDEPETIYGIRTNFDYKFSQTPHGRIYNGGAKFIIPKYYQGKEQKAFHRIMQGDIIVIDKPRRDTEILKKGIRDYLYAFDVKEIFVVSKEGTIYRPNIDYILNGKTIVWQTGGNAPMQGENYSVEYSCKQQFKVWDNGANSRGTDQEELPLNVLCVLRRYVETDETNILDSFTFQQEIFK